MNCGERNVLDDCYPKQFAIQNIIINDSRQYSVKAEFERTLFCVRCTVYIESFSLFISSSSDSLQPNLLIVMALHI